MVPADETMRATAYEKLLPPLVAKVRKEVFAWRNSGYAGASANPAPCYSSGLKPNI